MACARLLLSCRSTTLQKDAGCPLPGNDKPDHSKEVLILASLDG